MASSLGVYSFEKVRWTLDAMKARRDNLIQVSKTKIKVIITAN